MASGAPMGHETPGPQMGRPSRTGPTFPLAFVLAAAVTVAGWGFGAGPTAFAQDGRPSLRRPPLQTVAEIKALSAPDFNVQQPLALEGVVTLSDAARNMLVIQDATGAIALRPFHDTARIRPGQRVRIEAAACAPYCTTYPRYPFNPTRRDILPALDMPSFPGRYCLTRLRGWVRAPATGEYTFWIASDNSSQLWLSPSADPTQARRIAGVDSGDWTTPYEWHRFPSQRSEPQRLQAGELYYLETLLERQGGLIHVAVAWSGPGIEHRIIGGDHLIPWLDGPSEQPGALAQGQGQGLLREYWDGYPAATLVPLTGAYPAETGITARGVTITVVADAPFPDPEPVDLGQSLPLEHQFCWVEGEADVSFLARDGESLTMELAAPGQRPLLRVARWTGELPSSQTRWRVRFLGVCEAGRDFGGRLTPTRITAPTEEHVIFFEVPDSDQQARINWSPPSMPPVVGGYYFTRGVVTFSGRVLERQCLYVQEALGGLFVDTTNFPVQVPLAVGQKVEVGGNLLPGKHAPGIQPMAINVLGWQSLPMARSLSARRPLQNFRDGLWVEVEGVGRFVDEDGFLDLAGLPNPLQVWIGETPQEHLETCVNARMRIRGVLSLDIRDDPVLLVPSRAFVQVLMAAPPLPAHPQPLDTIAAPMGEDQWALQVKVHGAVTFQGPRHFYLQDGAAAVRVDHRLTSSPQVGEAVEAIGFPEADGAAIALADARWHALERPLTLEPVRLDRRELDEHLHGRLVTLQAQLFGRATRDGDQILELRSGDQIVEAALTTGAQTLPALETGSVLAVTGVGVMTSADGALSGGAGASRMRLLLRGPEDVVVLQGPPWWTWERMAFLIALLMAVLLGTLLILFYLSHRFSSQQEARLAFAREIMASQESERRRIASSLHDSLGQDLLVIRNQTNRVLQTAENNAHLRQRLEEISQTTLQAINSVREITHNLRPCQIDRLGLTQAIQSLVRKVSEHSAVEFACRVDDIDEKFDEDGEMHIYRIVQEGLNNIVKHAGATEATIVVRTGPASLSISIRDNGRGLPAGGAPVVRGLGLRSIQERVSLLSGAMKIDASSGQGLSLQIDIPLAMASK